MNISQTPEASKARPELDLRLAAARAQLDQGNWPAAEETALEIYQLAEQSGWRLYQGLALECLAHGDRLVSRFARAYEASSRSACIFKALKRPDLEGQALATLCHTASTLARNEEAIEAGRLSVELLQPLGHSPRLALAHNNLGVALFWGRQFRSAQAEFDESIAVTAQCAPATPAFQPLFNRVWGETFRIVCERNETGVLPDVSKRREYLEACRPFFTAEDPEGLVGGLKISLNAMGHLAVSLQQGWEGDHAGGMQSLGIARQWASKYEAATWLDALEKWISAEVHLTAGLPGETREELRRMREVSKVLEHEQLSLMSHGIGAYLAEAEGRWEDALDELKNQRALQQRIRRERRLSEARLQEWRSRRTGALGNEQEAPYEGVAIFSDDDLTGPAARDHVRTTVAKALTHLAQGGSPWPLLVVEVTNLVEIEQRHSSYLADEAMRSLGEVLASALAGEAMLAQTKPHQYVLVFGETGSASGANSAQKDLKRRVGAIDWSTVRPGLQVQLESRISYLDGEAASALRLL